MSSDLLLASGAWLALNGFAFGLLQGLDLALANVGGFAAIVAWLWRAS